MTHFPWRHYCWFIFSDFADGFPPSPYTVAKYKLLCLGFVVDGLFSGGAAGDFILTPHWLLRNSSLVFISAEVGAIIFPGRADGYIACLGVAADGFIYFPSTNASPFSCFHPCPPFFNIMDRNNAWILGVVSGFVADTFLHIWHGCRSIPTAPLRTVYFVCTFAR